MAGQPVYRESAVTCADGTYAVAIHIWFLFHVVYSRQIILHVLAAVVAGNLVVPFCAEAGQAATVGTDDDVAMVSHNLEIPAV